MQLITLFFLVGTARASSCGGGGEGDVPVCTKSIMDMEADFKCAQLGECNWGEEAYCKSVTYNWSACQGMCSGGCDCRDSELPPIGLPPEEDEGLD